ncbi:MAG: Na+/H+ antiporter subunit E [Pseudomonadota bacterium]
MTVLWLGLSGLFKPLILSLGTVSIVVSAILAMRLGLVDKEVSPYGRLPVFFRYWTWLVGEIFKANWTVIRACLRADLDIDPALVKVKTRCESDLAKTVFANSITLTPGTVTVEVDGGNLLVHALYENMAGPDAFDEMDWRAQRAVDGAPT